MGAHVADREGSEPDGRARRRIVGRRPQLARLSVALREAQDGHGSLVLVGGEVGSGKTRVAEAVADEAAATGTTVLWGSAWEAGGAPAYWPWTQVLRQLLRLRDARDLVEDLGAGAPYVAQISPELARGLPIAVEPAPSLDTEAARFGAFDATASFLRAAAARAPIVVVLDDLHAADVATVRLLEFLARGLRGAHVLALATHRADVPQDDDVAAALADLANAAQRLELGGLSRDEVRELAEDQAAAPLPPELVDRLHTLTQGNPLFVDEVVRLVAAQGLAAGSAVPGGLPIPDAVRDVMRRRLDPLDPAVRGTLTAAAVIGPEFELETLAVVTGRERAVLLAHLDAATAARLVDARPDAVGRYRFCHALTRETLYGDLAATDRAVLHGSVGEALAGRYEHRPDAPLSELAHHFLQAAPAGDAARAAVFAARAAEQARDAMAHEQAIDLFGDALRALELAPGAATDRGALFLGLGQAQIRAGRLAAGRETLRNAAAEARRRQDVELLARAALASAPWGLATARADEEELVPRLREALDRLPADDGALRARLLARLAAATYWSAPADRRAALIGEAIAMARRIGDPATLAFVLSDAHLATWDPDSPDRSLPWAAELYGLAEGLGNMELASIAHSWRISLLLELGELATVDQEIEAFAAAATRLHQQRAQAQALVHRCARAIIAGRLDEAEQLLGEAAGFAGVVQQDGLLGMRIGALAFVLREAQGRLPELEVAVEQFAQAQPAMPVWRCGLLCVYLQAGRETDLRRGYEPFALSGFASLPRDNLWLPALALLSEVCHHLRDATGAHVLRGLLEPFAGRNVVTPDVAFLGPVDRYLALLAATAGDDAAAASWFASARRLARAMGAGPTSARLALDEAGVLRTRDPARSRALAAEAATDAAALGLDWLVRRAHELGGTPDSPPPTRREPAVAAPRRLQRQGDVWEVVAGESRFHLKDAKGLRHLACLLAAPGQEFHALDLIGTGTPEAGAAEALAAGLGVRRAGQEDAGPTLDARAKDEYRRRIGELQEEVDEAERFHDPERARRAQVELDFVLRELSAAVGLGGRDRRAGGHAERARVNVTRALRGAVERIAAHDEALGHHLRTCVRTGMFCVYEPGPDAAAWEVDTTA